MDKDLYFFKVVHVKESSNRGVVNVMIVYVSVSPKSVIFPWQYVGKSNIYTFIPFVCL